jgi:DNA-binding NarL/FixJ family response regulator
MAREVEPMYRFFIVDDHESMCDALNLALSNTGMFTLAGKTTSSIAAEAACANLNPDLVFMDVCTGGGASGLDAAKKIRQDYPNIKVIVMSGFDEVSYMPRARDIGAHAFVFKSNSLSFFAEIAIKVMQGGSYWPEPKKIPMPTGETPLTEREMEVLRLVCMNMTNKEIAKELIISENTVKYHKTNMLAKTGFEKATDLAAYMIMHGWIRPAY